MLHLLGDTPNLHKISKFEIIKFILLQLIILFLVPLSLSDEYIRIHPAYATKWHRQDLGSGETHGHQKAITPPAGGGVTGPFHDGKEVFKFKRIQSIGK